MAEIRIKSVSKRFGKRIALSDFSLPVADGELVVLLGPSGAGKTTALRLVAGLEEANTGSIFIDRQDVTFLPPSARNVALVFQHPSLYPHLNVFDNLAFPLRAPAMAVSEADLRLQVETIASLLRIDGQLTSRTSQLSGDQMQRVSIGRALVRRPSVFLMDEPLAAIDTNLRSQFRSELKCIQKELGATWLNVTTDMTEAMTMADQIGIVDGGNLVQFGPPREIYEAPKNVYVATRLGSPAINMLPQGLLPDGGAPGGTKTVGVRTEHLGIVRVKGRRTSHGVVEDIRHQGDQIHLRLNLGEGITATTLIDPGFDLGVGDRVALELKYPLWFDAAGNRIAAQM